MVETFSQTSTRFWRRVWYHAWHETKEFFRATVGEQPIAAVIVIVYQLAFVAMVTALWSGKSVYMAVGQLVPLTLWGIGPLLLLTVAVLLWSITKAPFAVYRRQATVLSIARKRLTSLQESRALGELKPWRIEYPGGLSDVRVVFGSPLINTGTPFREERYAVATDVVIINQSPTKSVSLTAELLIQYGVTTLVEEPQSTEIGYWDALLSRFYLGAKPQLIFPINLRPESSVGGHIAFPINPDGAGHGIGGDETEKRKYSIEFKDSVSGEVRIIGVTAVSAPTLGQRHLATQTDLAYRSGSAPLALN